MVGAPAGLKMVLKGYVLDRTFFRPPLQSERLSGSFFHFRPLASRPVISAASVIIGLLGASWVRKQGNTNQPFHLCHVSQSDHDRRPFSSKE